MSKRLLTIHTIWRTFLAVHCILLLLFFAVPFPPVTTPPHQSEYIQRQIQAGSCITTVHPYSDTILHPSRTSSEDSPSPYVHDAWDGHIFTWQLQQIAPTDNIILHLSNPNGLSTQNFSIELDLTALATIEPSFVREPLHLSLATGDLHWPVAPYFSYADAILLSHQTHHTWQNGTLRLLIPETGTVQIWKNMPGWDTFDADNISSIDDTDRKQGLVASFSLSSINVNSTISDITLGIPHAHLPTTTHPFRLIILTLLTPLFTTIEAIFSLLVFVFSLSILLFSLITILLSNVPSLVTHLVPLYVLIVLVCWLLFGRGASFRAWSRRFWLTRRWAKWVFREQRVRVWSVNGPIGPDAEEGEGLMVQSAHSSGSGNGNGHRRNRSVNYGGVEKGGGLQK